MAYTIPCSNSDRISVEEFIRHVEGKVDLRDYDSLADTAPMLRALANDRSLVVNQLNTLVERAYSGGTIPSAQAVMLGRGENFYVRAAIWPSAADVGQGHLYQDQFAYHEAHDHNFAFMTVNYLGSGYETEIYEYDYEQVEGYVGEPVALKFLEKTRFGANSVMIYRAGKDVHIQYPAETLSITLNLMIALPEYRLRDQFNFDVHAKTISAYPSLQDSTKRTSLIGMAGLFGNARTQELLDQLTRKHPCRRSRLAAYEAMTRIAPEDTQRLWERACDDKERLIMNAAKAQLKKLGA